MQESQLKLLLQNSMYTYNVILTCLEILGRSVLTLSNIGR